MVTMARRGFLMTAFAAWAAEQGGEAIPFLDAQALNPERPRLPWDQTTEWITPPEHFFWVGHYGYPEVDAANWKLSVQGMVERPRTFTLDDLKRRPRREFAATLECSGNSPTGGLIGNARWTGTPLGPVLKECGVKGGAIEAVFFGADTGKEKIRGGEYEQQFARSLSVAEAMKDGVLVCYEMNGQPLKKNHGAPARLVVPGWYGVAWVKWLSGIELHDRAYLGRFTGRDYVTIRGEERDGKTIWRETAVGKMNLKSVVARVTRQSGGSLRVMGAAWSGNVPVRGVELRIDDGPWMPVELAKSPVEKHCWRFWSYGWSGAQPGEHTLASRATDVNGNVQPAPEDPFIKLKKTYWEANQWAGRKIKL
jgi:DMSO/TMAO reductase YedYZ molybdopterin-dependent catalytic subunit